LHYHHFRFWFELQIAVLKIIFRRQPFKISLISSCFGIYLKVEKFKSRLDISKSFWTSMTFTFSAWLPYALNCVYRAQFCVLAHLGHFQIKNHQGIYRFCNLIQLYSTLSQISRRGTNLDARNLFISSTNNFPPPPSYLSISWFKPFYNWSCS